MSISTSTNPSTPASASASLWLGQLSGQSSSELEQAQRQLETLLAQTKEREARQLRLSKVEAALAELAPALTQVNTNISTTQQRLNQIEADSRFIEQELFEGVG